MTKYRHYEGQATRTYRKLYGFKNLLAWQAADELAAMIHRAVIEFSPRYYRLSSQMLGSSSSVKANIAEGYCRNALGDYIRFCEIARGSLGELGSQLQDCERWGLLHGKEFEELLAIYGDATFMLEKLIKGLRAKRDQGDWDRSLTANQPSAKESSLKERPAREPSLKDPAANYTTGDADLQYAPPDDQVKD